MVFGKIRKYGKFHQRLASHQIDTVKDFMRKYVNDPTKLREMLDCPKGALDTIVEHATCDVNDENFFTCSVDGIGLLFNSVYKFVAATFDGQNYQSVDDPNFIDTPLVKSKREQAYRNVSSLVPVDGRDIFGPSKSLPSLQAEPSGGRGYRLLFANKLPSTIFTDSKIEAEIGGPVKTVLIDTISKRTVTSGPLSSIKI